MKTHETRDGIREEIALRRAVSHRRTALFRGGSTAHMAPTQGEATGSKPPAMRTALCSGLKQPCHRQGSCPMQRLTEKGTI